MELPPLWSIGYQQCRYSYYPDKEVFAVAQTFREKDIPADAIVFDIHYMEKYKIFTWDKKHFSDPKGLLAAIKKQGFHVVIMCDPGIKVEPGYEAYDDGVKQDIFLKYPDGENYQGQVWPGWCHFPDFTKPAARKWWASKFKDYVELGSNNKLVTFRVYYTSVLTGKSSFIKIQINFLEKIMFTPQTKELIPLIKLNQFTKEDQIYFNEFLGFYKSLKIEVYDIKEIVAEKVRSLLTRKAIKSRDAIDLLFIYNKFKIKPQDLLNETKEKLLFSRQTRFTG